MSKTRPQRAGLAQKSSNAACAMPMPEDFHSQLLGERDAARSECAMLRSMLFQYAQLLLEVRLNSPVPITAPNTSGALQPVTNVPHRDSPLPAGSALGCVAGCQGGDAARCNGGSPASFRTTVSVASPRCGQSGGQDLRQRRPRAFRGPWRRRRRRRRSRPEQEQRQCRAKRTRAASAARGCLAEEANGAAGDDGQGGSDGRGGAGDSRGGFNRAGQR